MTDGRVRSASKGRYVVYWQKAREFEERSRASLAAAKPNAATLDAVHAAISGVDAICVFNLGQRSVGQDHREALNLLLQIHDPSAKEQTKRFASLLDWNRLVEYEERLVTLEEAREVATSVTRLLAWGVRLLPARADRG